MPRLTPDEYDQWDQFVERSPQGTIFAKSSWLQGFERVAPRSQACVVVTRSKTGDLEAGVALLTKCRFGRRVAGFPALTSYTSVLLSVPKEHADENLAAARRCESIGRLLDEVAMERLKLVALEHSPALRDVREFVWRGWTVTPRYTYVQDLESFDPAVTMSKNHRKNYRKAAKLNYTVSCTEDAHSALDDFMTIFPNSFKTCPERFERDCRALRVYLQACRGKGESLCYQARDAQGSLQAARIVLLSCHSTALDLGAATTDEGRSAGATAFLVAEMLKDLRGRGMTNFDFCGANTPAIAQFKAGFNGSLVPYYATRLEGFGLLSALRKVKNAVVKPPRHEGR